MTAFADACLKGEKWRLCCPAVSMLLDALLTSKACTTVPGPDFVVEVAKNISHTIGSECLKKIAKMHFKTTRVVTEND